MTASHVSAVVTHGSSDTQRTPRPGTTNVLQPSRRRALASAPWKTPPSTG